MVIASLFEIAVGIYSLVAMLLGLWGVVVLRKRMAGKFPITRQDFELLRKEAKSPWDPFSEVGVKRWRLILFAMFGLLVVINFMGW